jgi:hypothetical protein
MSKMIGSENVTLVLPNDAPPELEEALRSGGASVAFTMTSDEGHVKFIKELRPLVERGVIVPRPNRIIMYVKRILEDGKRHWEIVEASPIKPDQWDISNSEDLRPEKKATLELSPVSENEKRVCEIVTPYVENISMADLCLILEDEADILREFRSDIRTLLQEAAKGGRDAREIAQDIVGPRVNKLERRFKSIARMTKLRLSGITVGTAALSLVSLIDTGLGAAFTAVAGAAGLGAFTKEYSAGLEQLDTLKSDPTYLLWKLSHK